MTTIFCKKKENTLKGNRLLSFYLFLFCKYKYGAGRLCGQSGWYEWLAFHCFELLSKRMRKKTGSKRKWEKNNETQAKKKPEKWNRCFWTKWKQSLLLIYKIKRRLIKLCWFFFLRFHVVSAIEISKAKNSKVASSIQLICILLCSIHSHYIF